jgi:acyl-CoA thioesterase
MNKKEADDLARACAESMYARDIAAQSVGIRIHEVKSGYACLQMTVLADMLNGHDICHGGFLFTLADTAFAYACNSYNRISVAQNCEIDFIRTGGKGDEVTAVAEESYRGSKTGIYDVSLTRQDGKLLALFRGRSYQIEGDVIQ